MNDMEKLYREVMNDHYKNPRNKGLKNQGITCRKRNPSCGDDITIELELEGDTIKHLRHDEVGCLICCSSASVMSSILEGKTIDEAKEMSKSFSEMLMGEKLDEDMAEKMDEALIYQGVSKYPARIKCACLPWKALDGALEQDDE